MNHLSATIQRLVVLVLQDHHGREQARLGQPAVDHPRRHRGGDRLREATVAPVYLGHVADDDEARGDLVGSELALTSEQQLFVRRERSPGRRLDARDDALPCERIGRADDDGLVHEYDEVLSGEAMSGGPLMLSWRDVRGAGRSAAEGYNVVETDLLGIVLPPGVKLRRLLSVLLSAEINVHYMYPLLTPTKGRNVIAMHVEEPDSAARTLIREGMRVVNQDDLT